MNSFAIRSRRRAISAALASALAVSLAACSEKQTADDLVRLPPPPDSSFHADRPPETAGEKLDRATETASQKLEETGDVIRDQVTHAGKALEDATITARVKSALVSEPGLKSAAINVDTNAGVVTLKGTADSQANRKKAELLASTVQGVRSVRNELIVIPG